MKPRATPHLSDRLEHTLVAALKPARRNARTHSKAQIHQIADSIERFGFTNPILIDAEGRVLAGHGRLAAARQLGMEHVPTLCLAHLSEAERRAYVLTDNKLAEKAGWDRELLALELGELGGLLEIEGLDLAITGFETAEIDTLLGDFGAPEQEPEDVLPEPGPPVVATGDLWILGKHRLDRKSVV